MPAIFVKYQQTTSFHNISLFFNELIKSHKKAQEAINLLGPMPLAEHITN